MSKPEIQSEHAISKIKLAPGVRISLMPIGEGFWRFNEHADGVLEVSWEAKNPEMKEWPNGG